MRCSCHVCDTYMNQSEGPQLGCVCPNCGYRCKACLGTNSVISREDLKRLKDDARLMREIFTSFDPNAPEADVDPSPDKWGEGQWLD